MALTSAGSMRNLAKLVGVSHQKIGRWLREGLTITDTETGEIKRDPRAASSIPESAESSINLAFHIHNEITKDQARKDKLPYSAVAPVFVRRMPLRDGKPGARVLAANTSFIKPELRNQFLTAAQKSKKYIAASVRSTVNLRDYAKRAAATEIKQTGRRITKAKLTQHILETLTRMDRVIVPTDYEMPIYTRMENIGTGTETKRAISGITDQLRNKHEASAAPDGLADQILFQTPTIRNEKPPTLTKRKSGNSKANLTRR